MEGLTLTELLAAGCTFWPASRKAAVVRALLDGSLTAADARERYLLSGEELLAWCKAFRKRGVQGLLVKAMQRDKFPSKGAGARA